LDKTVYMSGDWYILLLMMKYACKARARGWRSWRQTPEWGRPRRPRLTLFGGNALSFMNDEQRRRLSMHNGKLDTDETSAKISLK
jgi:hypothetical protein